MQLDLPFLTSVLLPHSQLWATVIKEKPQSSKVTHWAILINPKVIWKFTMTQLCWAVDVVYQFWMHHLQSWWFFPKIVSGFNSFFSSLKILLTYPWSVWQCTMILVEIVHMPLDRSIQHLPLSNCIFIILTFIIHWY